MNYDLSLSKQIVVACQMKGSERTRWTNKLCLLYLTISDNSKYRFSGWGVSKSTDYEKKVRGHGKSFGPDSPSRRYLAQLRELRP